jgi:hypothetical protein
VASRHQTFNYIWPGRATLCCLYSVSIFLNLNLRNFPFHILLLFYSIFILSNTFFIVKIRFLDRSPDARLEGGWRIVQDAVGILVAVIHLPFAAARRENWYPLSFFIHAKGTVSHGLELRILCVKKSSSSELYVSYSWFIFLQCAAHPPFL